MTASAIDPVDALVLDQARELLASRRPGAVVVLDDTSGALCRGAAQLSGPGADGSGAPSGQTQASVLAFCDSLVDERALHRVGVDTLNRLDELASRLESVRNRSGTVLALVRLPKSLSALQEYAEQLALAGIDQVIAGGRVKHMTRGMNEVLTESFSQVRASLGRQKCRALLASGPTPGPVTWPRSRRHTEVATASGPQQIILSAHGATFGGNGIDLGTRLLLEHLDPGRHVCDPADANFEDAPVALDLGSGNGTIAVVLASAGLRTLACDVSAAAVAATAESAAANGVTVQVHRADGLSELPDASVDLIACNPPFHVGTAKDSGPALAMFDDAARVLTVDGQFWCVFNSHLPWLPRLRRQIGPTTVVAQDRRFTVTRSTRQRG